MRLAPKRDGGVADGLYDRPLAAIVEAEMGWRRKRSKSETPSQPDHEVVPQLTQTLHTFERADHDSPLLVVTVTDQRGHLVHATAYDAEDYDD
jgi:hypothetical protein